MLQVSSNYAISACYFSCVFGSTYLEMYENHIFPSLQKGFHGFYCNGRKLFLNDVWSNS